MLFSLYTLLAAEEQVPPFSGYTHLVFGPMHKSGILADAKSDLLLISLFQNYIFHCAVYLFYRVLNACAYEHTESQSKSDDIMTILVATLELLPEYGKPIGILIFKF